jgi:mRNA-degrading endonuclease YafQ of YafQ-DinJ toxin-antitoxin module
LKDKIKNHKNFDKRVQKEIKKNQKQKEQIENIICDKLKLKD